MKTPRLRRLPCAFAALGLLTVSSPFAFADFSFTGAGPYDYNTTGNWSGGTINNTWSTALTANQAITFAADTTLSGTTFGITNNSLFNHTFTGSGGNRTLTLGAGISLGSNATNANTITLGSLTDGQKLNVDLGGAGRTFFTGTNRTLEIINTLSGTGGVAKTGLGTLRLIGTNTYTGGTSIGASNQASGILEVTKLADGGQDSSIGKSTNDPSSLAFGGNTAGGGTLRYIGSGDSTNRRFLVGGSGAIFDASGTGALLWTNTASPDVSPSAGQARTITLKGTSTHNNTMSATFIDSGAGKTAITKDGVGTWILAGNNTATGDITVTAGKLAISADNRLANTARLVMNGGTFSTAGFAETLGTLQLTATSVIDLGTNPTGSALVFANSAAEVWTGSISLTFSNFTDGTDSVFFGIGGLTVDQLAQIRINGTHLAILDGSGFLALGAAIPEPSTYALLFGVGGLVLAASRRQRRAV